jgi:hypothetical protein
MADQVDEIMLLTQEAYKLASTACHFDRMQNYVGACDYYDKCLLNMDEVLNKLPPDSAEWKRLYEMRTKYDDRMELLRDNDNANSFSLTALAGGKNETTRSSLKLPRNRRKLTDAETDFKDIDWNEASEEATPEDPSEAIYWILRNVRKTMDPGGFLTNDIFLPKRVWMQQDVKFSGLGAKSAAFDIILKLISGHVEALYLSTDEDSLDLAEASFLAVYEELVALQNNLSKPFPYIKELKISDSKEDAVETSSSASATQPKGSVRSYTPHFGSLFSMHCSFLLTPTELFLILAQNGSGRAATLSSFVSSFGKNVRKYAEVGFQRLVVALPSKLSAEELEEYVALVTKLCDKCQVRACVSFCSVHCGMCFSDTTNRHRWGTFRVGATGSGALELRGMVMIILLSFLVVCGADICNVVRLRQECDCRGGSQAGLCAPCCGRQRQCANRQTVPVRRARRRRSASRCEDRGEHPHLTHCLPARLAASSIRNLEFFALFLLTWSGRRSARRWWASRRRCGTSWWRSCSATSSTCWTST